MRLTKSAVKGIAKAISLGYSRSAACRAMGFSKLVWKKWENEIDEMEIEPLSAKTKMSEVPEIAPRTDSAEGDGPRRLLLAYYLRETAKAFRSCADFHLENIAKQAVEEKQWTASAFILQSLDREEFGRPIKGNDDDDGKDERARPPGVTNEELRRRDEERKNRSAESAETVFGDDSVGAN